MLLYIQQHGEDVSMAKDYQHCLHKLAAAAPERKSALIRSLLPGIEAALNSGQYLKTIWKALRDEGLQMSYRSFHMTSRAPEKQGNEPRPAVGGNGINLLSRKGCPKHR